MELNKSRYVVYFNDIFLLSSLIDGVVSRWESFVFGASVQPTKQISCQNYKLPFLSSMRFIVFICLVGGYLNVFSSGLRTDNIPSVCVEQNTNKNNKINLNLIFFF